MESYSNVFVSALSILFLVFLSIVMYLSIKASRLRVRLAQLQENTSDFFNLIRMLESVEKEEDRAGMGLLICTTIMFVCVAAALYLKFDLVTSYLDRVTNFRLGSNWIWFILVAVLIVANIRLLYDASIFQKINFRLKYEDGITQKKMSRVEEFILTMKLKRLKVEEKIFLLLLGLEVAFILYMVLKKVSELL